MSLIQQLLLHLLPPPIVFINMSTDEKSQSPAKSAEDVASFIQPVYDIRSIEEDRLRSKFDKRGENRHSDCLRDTHVGRPGPGNRGKFHE
jgi:hypothetical protein